MRDSIIIRPVAPHELGEVRSFIRELAVYERLAEQAVATEADLAVALFGPRPFAEVVFACVAAEPGGFALFFHNFSTLRGKPGLYLEDLFVRPQARGRGIGRLLLAWLARTAVERGCARLDWAVLDWNAPAIAFYRKLGAVPHEEWTTFEAHGRSARASGALVTLVGCR
jgi:GNAT superfamily N-acetyltransferase